MAQVNYKNIKAYIQGNFRYKLYYSKWFSWLIPNYIHEQIDVRIDSMNRECYMKGSCTMCGCKTTHLQMANKTCAGNCYPDMLSRKQWCYLKKRKMLLINKVLWKFKDNKFEKI